jgi:hypothetical protein
MSPLALKLVEVDSDARQLFLAYFFCFGVVFFVEPCVDFSSGFGPGVRD